MARRDSAGKLCNPGTAADGAACPLVTVRLDFSGTLLPCRTLTRAVAAPVAASPAKDPITATRARTLKIQPTRFAPHSRSITVGPFPR